MITLKNVSELVKKMSHEVFGYCDSLEMLDVEKNKVKSFKVKDTKVWEQNEIYADVLKRCECLGVSFTYQNGVITFVQMSKGEFENKSRLKKAVFERYVTENQIKVDNKKIDALISSQLEGCKEIEITLPYYTQSPETVILMFTKDTPEKNWVGLEKCDVFIFNRDFESYSKLKTPENGITEIFSNEVLTSNGVGEDGHVIFLRENCIIDSSDSKLYLVPVGKKTKESVTSKLQYS